MTRVVVIGGGAAGVLAAVALAGSPDVTSVFVVGRDERIGPGLAYGRAQPHHLLNSHAGRMSAVQSDATHFVRWCTARGLTVGPHDFAPRLLYGDYLAEVFTGLLAEGGGRVRAIRGEVVEAVPVKDGVVVRLADGTRLEAEAVVLAVGTPPPAAFPTSTRIVADPWAPRALDTVAATDRALLIGTGLTAVDVATALARRDIRTRITATSRSLLLPRTHLDHHVPPGPGLPPSVSTLGEVVAAFSQRVRVARAEGRPWQAEVDGVRPQVNSVWAALSVDDRRRFVSRLARRWEVHRHRMAPSVAAEVGALISDGVLRLEAHADPAGFDVVIDCTGPRGVAAPGWSPLVSGLLAAGTVRPDALGIGLDVTAEGAVRDAAGRVSTRLFVLGTARRGSQWESTAVPEIRLHARAIADAMTS